MVGVRHHRLTVGGQAGHHEGRPGPDIGRTHRRPGERFTPRTTAWWPSTRMSAPMRTSSGMYLNLPANTFSVRIPTPSATDSSATSRGL